MLRLRAFNPASVTDDPVLELGLTSSSRIRFDRRRRAGDRTSLDHGTRHRAPDRSRELPTLTVTKTATGGDHDDPPDGAGTCHSPGEDGRDVHRPWANVRKNDSGASVTASTRWRNAWPT